MSPTRLLLEFSGPELQEQLAFSRIEPLEDPWWMMGQICTVIAQSMTGDKDARPERFIPYIRPVAQPKIQSAAEGIAKMKLIAAAFQARQNRGGS